MFNDDQKGWMKSLAALPLEAKCGCGWDRLGQCYVCRMTAARVRGVVSREVPEHPHNRVEYLPPDSPPTDWAGLGRWLMAVAPACFGEPPAPDGWAYNAPWVRLDEPLRCPTCRAGLLARACARGSRGSRERLTNWCRTCGGVWTTDESSGETPLDPRSDPLAETPSCPAS